MLKLVGIGEFSDMADWKESIYTFVLTEVICKVCNYCYDLDICRDANRVMKEGV